MATERGFTASELLMVMLLLGMGGLAVFHCTRVAPPQARLTACSSNVRQLSLALSGYAQDCEGKLPPGPRAWEPAQVYIKNEQVQLCPAKHRPAGPVSGESDYLFDYRLRSDDLPQSLLVADDSPDRHYGRYWVGSRLDGAVFVWPASEWQNRIGGLIANESATGQ